MGYLVQVMLSLGSGVVSWRSRKQSVPADSTTEVEYVAATEAIKKIAAQENSGRFACETSAFNSTHD